VLLQFCLGNAKVKRNVDYTNILEIICNFIWIINKKFVILQKIVPIMNYSVITINYNNGEGLRRTIKSVVGQSYMDFEYIVIDGGSTDGSVDVIREYANKIDYWVSEPDGGIYNAMNKGVARAHGEYCIFLNSGDCFYDKTVLERVYSTNHIEDIVIGKLCSASDSKGLFQPPMSGRISLYYLYSSTIPHQSSFIRTELLRKIPYDESLKIVSDWKFFVQAIILENCSVRYVDANVALFDMEGVSTSNPERMWEEKEKVLSTMFPPRVLEDYKIMKASECLTHLLAPQLRQHYRIDKFLFRLGKMILKQTNEKHGSAD
jgi:Glycosyltransferases involved in cell wall biogenesis